MKSRCYLPYQQVIQQEPLQTGILPLDVLIYPIWVRFQYHFMSQQPTNNAEKVNKSVLYYTFINIMY